MRTTIEKNSFIFDWKIKLKRDVNLVKGQRKIKRIRIKIDIKNKKMFWLKGEIKKNNNFFKGSKKKNQKSKQRRSN